MVGSKVGLGEMARHFHEGPLGWAGREAQASFRIPGSVIRNSEAGGHLILMIAA